MTHILIAYKQFPAPSVGHAGGESLFHMMAALHRRGHTLTLVSRIADEERALLPEVEAICRRVVTVRHHRSRPGPRPWAVATSYLQLRRAIRDTVAAERPDFVHVETTQTALVAAGLPLPPSSYRTQDVNWFLVDQQLPWLSGLRRATALVKRAAMRRLEPWIAGHYDVLIAISEGDRRLLADTWDRDLLLVPLTPLQADAALRRDVPPGRLPAAPPLVDRPTADAAPAQAAGDCPTVLFVGAMARDHNQDGIRWFLDQVWSHIVAVVPDASLRIVGGSPPAWLLSRADGERVVVTGFVADLVAEYRAADVFVSPLLVAGGLLQKVLDAMALGLPVVATSVCNHGVSAAPGQHLVTADESEAFADAVVTLLRDPEARDRIAAAARSYIAATYDFDAAVDLWSGTISALCVPVPSAYGIG